VQEPTTQEVAKKLPLSDRAETNDAIMTFSGATSSVADRASAPLSDKIARLPAPWAARRIGNIPGATWAAAENGDFVVHGAGQNIDKMSDNFFFVQRSASGSMDFISRLKSAGREIASRQGIMVRESIRADASFAFIGLSQTRIFWVHRDNNSNSCQFTDVPIAPPPVYLRLTKRTNSVCGAYSTNGTHWTWLGTNQIAVPDQNYLIGLAVSSGDARSVATVFDQVTVKNL
jgi:hypothetical protein